MNDTYMDQIVTREAPRWAWEIIDETLFMDAQSKAFDSTLRDDIHAANQAMMVACEEEDRQSISRAEIDSQD